MKHILLTAVLTALTMLTTLPAATGENAIPAAADSALKEAKEFTLLSLEPTPGDANDGFHSYKILGQTSLAGKDHAAAETALRAAQQNWDKQVVRCFMPRHGLRVKSKSVTYDFVICYQCQSVQVYEGDKQIGHFGITAKPDALNKLLTDAKIPLPAGPEKTKKE